MSPCGDSFLSGSNDGTARLWDLRTPDCSGIMYTTPAANGARASVATSYDQEGVIFAAAIGNNSIKLYDVRNYDAGPFSTFSVSFRSELHWRNIEFSNDGKLILLTTPHGIIVVDSFEGNLVSEIEILYTLGREVVILKEWMEQIQNISGYNNRKGYPVKASFTPDGKYILIGGEDGIVHVFNSSSGTKTATWNANPPHSHPVGNVMFNPRSLMAVSAGKTVAFWIPELK